MFIQTEDTPNPATMKFLPSRTVVASPVSFEDRKAAERSPLASALFAVDGVESVFFGTDFISVTRAPQAEWASLRPVLLSALMDHFLAQRPVMLEEELLAPFGQEDEVSRKIRALLDERIRPAIAQDGGDVSFEGYEDGIVYLRLKGACAGCPGATATLKNGIENMLRHFIPEVEEVRRVM